MQEEGIAVWIGVDWGDERHEVYGMDGKGEIWRETIEQTPEGVRAWMGSVRKRYPEGRIAVAVEQRHGPFVWSLMDYEFVDIYPINPLALKRFAEAYRVSGAKDDPTDAKLACEMVVKHPEWLRRWEPDSVETRQMRRLTELRRGKVDERTAVTNQLRDALKQYYPQALECLGELDTKMSCDFLEEFPTLGIRDDGRARPLRNRTWT